MKIKQVQRILMTNFLFVLLVGFLLVLLYETEILEPTNLAGDVTLVYVITVAMEFLTIAVIPLALKLFSFKAIHRQLEMVSAKSSTSSLLRLSIKSTRRKAVLRPIPGNLENSATAFSNKVEENCCCILAV